MPVLVTAMTIGRHIALLDQSKSSPSPRRAVIASEAKQSRKSQSKDWIASSLALLAMTNARHFSTSMNPHAQQPFDQGAVGA
jgi:hypothetical protein